MYPLFANTFRRGSFPGRVDAREGNSSAIRTFVLWRLLAVRTGNTDQGAIKAQSLANQSVSPHVPGLLSPVYMEY